MPVVTQLLSILRAFPLLGILRKHNHLYITCCYNINGVGVVLDLRKPFPLAVKNLFLVATVTCRRMKKIEGVRISPSYTKFLGITIYVEGPWNFMLKITFVCHLI